MKKLAHFLLIVVGFSSCITEVDIPIEYSDPNLVINGLFTTDSLWSVEISVSSYIYDTTAMPLIDDATVEITNSEGASILLNYEGDGIYSSATERPVEGETYTIKVTHNGYTNVQAVNTLPRALDLLAVTHHESAVVDGENFKKFRVTFKDPSGADYYLVKLKGYWWEHDWQTGDSTLTSYPIELMSENAVIENNSEKFPQMSLSFTDELFEGTEFTFDFLVYEEYFDKDWGIPSLDINVSRISQEYYWYETSYQKYLMSQNAIFAQPVQVYTNVTDGLGVFAGYSGSIRNVEF